MARRKSSIDLGPHRERFARFLAEREAACDALRAFARAAGRPEVWPLDHSVDSIDRVESLLGLVLSGGADPGIDVEAFGDRVATYLGETLVRTGRGRWALSDDPDSPTFGLPGVADIPHTHPTWIWVPRVAVWAFQTRRETGQLRRAFDLNVKPDRPSPA